VALVDHNESGQAVDGIFDCEIMEIVDHHKLGYVQSMKPVIFPVPASRMYVDDYLLNVPGK